MSVPFVTSYRDDEQANELSEGMDSSSVWPVHETRWTVL